MKLYILCIWLVGVFLGCNTDDGHVLKVRAKHVSAEKEGNILAGLSVLNDPNRFVWGTIVIKADRLERQQLLIDENGDPNVLYCASAIVNVNPRQDGTSYNVHILLEVGR